MKKYFFSGPIILLVIWWVVAELKLIDPFFLPNPKDTLIELFGLFSSGIIIKDIIATLLRTIEAFFIAMILGVPLGLFLGKFEKVYRSLEFIIDFFRSTPATAIFPLFLLIFGITDNSKIAVAAFGAILIILFNTAYGVINSAKSRISAAKTMGASNRQIFRHVIFWESLPQTFIGMRSAISLSLVIIVVTEMFIGTNIGIGRRIIDSQLIYNIKAMYASILIAGVLGYLLNYILLALERKFVHWN